MKECKNCKWHVGSPGCKGDCHRHAPFMRLLVTTDRYLEYYGIWPETRDENSCGDFEVKE